METTVFDLATGRAPGVFDITGRAASFVADKGSGLLNVFVPHATAGVAVLETGAGSEGDLLDRIGELLPRDDAAYRHRHGAPGHGADHVLPAIVAPTATIPVIDGTLALGTWQSIVVVDTNVDNPVRTVRLSFVG
jgi:secondary thiamine-phosphate synthase enzyme